MTDSPQITVTLEERRRPTKSGRTRSYWTLRWVGPDGTRHSESLGKGVETKTQALKVKRKKETDLDTGKALASRPKRMTLAELVEYTRANPDLAPRTRLEYAACGKQAVNVIGGRKPIDRISMADVNRLKTSLADLSQATRDKIIRHLRAMLNVAVRDELLARNPIQKYKAGKPKAKAARIYTEAEIGKLIAAAPSSWWRTYLQLATATGLRSGEMLALRWADVDFDAKTVTVRRRLKPETFTVEDKTYTTLPFRGKSDAALRTVPVGEATVKQLSAFLEEADGSPYVFVSLERLARINTRQTTGKWKADDKWVNNVLTGFHRIHRNAGLPVPLGSIHDLRKTFCTLTSRLVPMKTLQLWAGHANIATTAEYYCRETEADAEKLRAAEVKAETETTTS